MFQHATRRGRPITQLVDRLRVTLWAHSVMYAMGASSIKELEARLIAKHRIRLASGLWSRYMRGEVVPQGAIGFAKGSLVERLGAAYPMTAATFHYPVWRYLPWTGLVDLDGLRNDYLSLGDSVAVHFVARVAVRRERTFPDRASFWHMGKSMADRQKTISAFEPWTRLALWLMEARMAYAGQQHHRFVQCQLMACSELAALQKRVPPRSMVFWTYLLMEGMCLDALVSTTLAVNIPEFRDVLRDSSNEARRAWKNRVQGCLDISRTNDRKTAARRLDQIWAWRLVDWRVG